MQIRRNGSFVRFRRFLLVQVFIGVVNSYSAAGTETLCRAVGLLRGEQKDSRVEYEFYCRQRLARSVRLHA